VHRERLIARPERGRVRRQGQNGQANVETPRFRHMAHTGVDQLEVLGHGRAAAPRLSPTTIQPFSHSTALRTADPTIQPAKQKQLHQKRPFDYACGTCAMLRVPGANGASCIDGLRPTQERGTAPSVFLTRTKSQPDAPRGRSIDNITAGQLLPRIVGLLDCFSPTAQTPTRKKQPAVWCILPDPGSRSRLRHGCSL
jgi:hypothetical protein